MADYTAALSNILGATPPRYAVAMVSLHPSNPDETEFWEFYIHDGDDMVLGLALESTNLQDALNEAYGIVVNDGFFVLSAWTMRSDDEDSDTRRRALIMIPAP